MIDTDRSDEYYRAEYSIIPGPPTQIPWCLNNHLQRSRSLSLADESINTQHHPGGGTLIAITQQIS